MDSAAFCATFTLALDIFVATRLTIYPGSAMFVDVLTTFLAGGTLVS